MLKLKPNCEHCNCDLPTESPDARICSYECTFCASCVEGVLENVCPNCGGGFVPRPVRPINAYREGVSLTHQPASDERFLKPIDADAHKAFANEIKCIKPESR
jgi:hypothetical protein